MMPTERVMPNFCDPHQPVHFTTALNILAGMGIDATRIDLLAVGRHQNYSGEVHEQEPAPGSPVTDGVQIVLKIGLSSPVDYMPYQFFQGAGDWEGRARALMAPFDSSVIRYAADARLLALKYNFGVVDIDHLARLLRLFHFQLDGMVAGSSEALLWASLFPYFHLWSGNAQWIVAVLEYFFPWKFRIRENICSEYQIPDALRYRLGSREGRLGRESILGHRFCEWDSAYELVVMGVKHDEVPGLFPGEKVRAKIEWLLQTCMPGNLDCHIRIEVDAAGAVIGQEHGRAYLGYAAYLQRPVGQNISPDR